MAKKKAGSKMNTEAKVDIRLRVDVEMERRIRAQAEADGNSVAAYIRRAVMQRVERDEQRREGKE